MNNKITERGVLKAQMAATILAGRYASPLRGMVTDKRGDQADAEIALDSAEDILRIIECVEEDEREGEALAKIEPQKSPAELAIDLFSKEGLTGEQILDGMITAFGGWGDIISQGCETDEESRRVAYLMQSVGHDLRRALVNVKSAEAIEQGWQRPPEPTGRRVEPIRVDVGQDLVDSFLAQAKAQAPLVDTNGEGTDFEMTVDSIWITVADVALWIRRGSEGDVTVEACRAGDEDRVTLETMEVS